MSGGSYNYLCHKDANDIHEHRQELNAMRDRLIELGHLDAAKETESVLLMLDDFYVRLQARIERLNPIWRAVEWCDSCDWGKEDVIEAVEKYRSL